MKPDPNVEAVRQGLPEPNGIRYEWVVDPRWQTPAVGKGRCRFVTGPGHQSCGRPTVASFNRNGSRRGVPVDNWWDYCERHLYGAVIDDGQVWTLRPVPDG